MSQQTELLSNKEAAAFLGITPGTLSVWRCENRYPIPYIPVGSKIRYRVADLQAFLDSRRVDPATPRRTRKRRSAK
jgi:Helix-turn-helix domain